MVFKVTAKLLFFVFLFYIPNNPVFAADSISTNSAEVSATVISTTFNPPILVAPNDNSATKNTREPLVFRRPSPIPVTPLHHYDLYLDGLVFAASISDSVIFQNYYLYSVSRTDDTFTLNFNSDLTQGYHTWKVIAYNTAGTSSSSETRTYYIDSVYPYIVLQKVDHQTLNWDTRDSNTIPDISQRSLTVTTPNPLLTGTVEPYANMQIILMCPQNILNCQNQTWQGNYPTGIWQHRFYGLVRGLVYTVYISATDSAGNSTIFPEFFLAYGITSPTATTTPTITTAPEASPSPTPLIEIPPTPFIPAPPVSPTPPVFLTATPTAPKIGPEYWLLIILVLGLPLHLFMTYFGTKTRFGNLIKFLFVLLFPFLGKKDYQTTPFTTLDMFDPDKLDSAWQSKLSDINGYYGLTSPLLDKIFIKISCTGRYWKNVIINGTTLPNICLFPILDDTTISQDRLRIQFMKFRSIPLIIACLTSAFALTKQPNYFFLIYLYLSLQLAFSEYLYPKISK